MMPKFSRLFAALLLFSPAAFADESSSFGINLGGSFEVGRLQNSSAGLSSRTMTSENLELMPGYSINPDWFVGILGTYRFGQQQTSLSTTHNTNSGGNAWLIGPGAAYQINPKWAVQLNVLLLGNDSIGESDALGNHIGLKSPIGVDLKLQYFIAPLWSLDGVFDYTSWQTLTMDTSSMGWTTNQWMIGVGFTFHFNREMEPKTKTAEVAVKETPKAEAPTVLAPEVQQPRSEPGFELGRAELSSQQKDDLSHVAEELKAHPETKVEVYGYTDNVGAMEFNSTLSQRRADAAKKELMRDGIAEDRITAIGKGPIESEDENKTRQERIQNRRIEVRIH